LTAAGLIEADLARRLHGLASGNAPAALDVGIVHQDLQPQNLLRCDGELWAIDPELLDVSALDADLGRSCYLWPMPDLARQAFLRGYERYRSATPFVQHELFWAIVSVAGGARYWHEVGPLDHRLIAALHALARGELPLPWVRDPVVSVVGQGRRIRVAVVCDYLAIGGQERVILNLLKGLDRSRFEPFVYAFRGGEMVAAVEAAGAPLTIGSLKEPLGWRDWNGEDMREKDDWNRRLADALRRDGIDAAFVFAWDGGIEAARRAGVPVLIERLDGPGLLGKLPDKSAFDKLICESSTIRALLLERATELRLNPDRIEVIYSGIDLERFDPSRYDRVGMRREIGIEDEDVVIATISRLAPGKNIELLMQALIQVRRDRPARPIRLLVMGPDHGALESLQRMAGEHPLLGERVLFLPPCENVAPTLAAADIFAMTSVGEGIPNAILEAMAMGLPIVSTRVGSIHEVVHRNGMLAGAGDAGAVASCLARLIDRPEDRQRMARESRSVAQRYGLRATMGRYEDLVVNLLGRARRDP
jgi:glycosyltransferase involved in cell wall biosynthesis